MELSKNRRKAIEILESISEYLGKNKIADEKIFDCKNGNTTWYDLEDKVTELLDKKEETMKKFKCFRCGEVFESKYASKVDKNLCKYCEEFDDENGELKERI